MAIRTTNSGVDFELAPAGMHVARCYRVIDCGTQTNATFGKKQRKGWLFWELPNTSKNTGEKAGEPFIVGKQYTLSHNEKSNLRADLESWYAQHFDDAKLDEAGGFELERLVGRTALLNVVHSADGKYANVMAVNPLPAGMVCPPAFYPTVVFGFDPYDPAKFAALSQGMQDYIKKSEEWQWAAQGHAPPDPNRDGLVIRQPQAPAPVDVPFGPTPPPPPRQAPARPTVGGAFADMEDDIPF